MLANSREELVEVFDALDAELDRLDEVSFEVLTTPERLRSLERLECLARRLPAAQHTLINQLDTQASEEELGGTLCCALANRLRITKPEAALPKPARKNWAARCAARWPTGYASPSPKPPYASPTPPISDLVEHSPANR